MFHLVMVLSSTIVLKLPTYAVSHTVELSCIYVDANARRLNQILVSGFRRDVDEICALLGYYSASCGKCLPTFRENVSVPSSRVKSPSRKERKPATYNVDSIWEGAGGVAISRRDDTRRRIVSQKRAHLIGSIKPRILQKGENLLHS
jgi:hypothetical protein